VSSSTNHLGSIAGKVDSSVYIYCTQGKQRGLYYSKHIPHTTAAGPMCYTVCTVCIVLC